MWTITTHGFTFQELLILAAMNIEARSVSDEKREQKHRTTEVEVTHAV